MAVNDLFQSTLPARGATGCVGNAGDGGLISIHAPREGSDVGIRVRTTAPCVFQSTLPARGATRDAHKAESDAYRFQSTLPARGATHELGIIAI